MNNKQVYFIEKVKAHAALMVKLSADSAAIKSMFDELHSTGDDYSLDPADAIVTTAELTAMGVNYADLTAAINQAVNGYVNFYTGAAVTTREYGIDIRTITDLKI